MPQVLVGLFLDSAQARKITAELVGLGVPGKDIEVLDAYVSTFEQRIDGAGIPNEDAAIYKEGVRRGGALVLAGVESSLTNRAGELMDDHGAADIEDLAQAWALKDDSAEQERAGGNEQPAAGIESAATVLELRRLPEEFNANSGERMDSAQPLQPEPVEPEHLAAFPAGDSEIELPGGLRLRSVQVETPVERNVAILAEHLTFERRPADREATASDFQAFEQGVMDLVELAEELIVSKRARVVEEVVITKKVRETTETVKENLKRTHLTATFPSGPGSAS